MDYDLVRQTTMLSMVWQILNGVVYHIQSMAAWVLMEYISAVTHRSLNIHYYTIFYTILRSLLEIVLRRAIFPKLKGNNFQ